MQNRPFCGLVYRKLFFRDDSLSRIVVITLTPSSFLCLAIGSTSHAAPLTVTFLLTFKIMGDFWPFNWVRIWRLLSQTHFRTIITIWLQDRFGCYEMAFFAGSYIEGSFFKAIFFPKIMNYPCLILSYFFDSTEKHKSYKSYVACDFSVNFWKDGCLLGAFVGYLLRASFFKTTFNFRHCHCCNVSTSIDCSVDRRYFNQAATSTIFSKNFLTNFFFRLLFGLSRCLPIRGTIFRKP